MLFAFCVRTASLFATVVLTLAATATAGPCCKVTEIDRARNMVTAEDAATGTTFEFRLLDRELDGLAVGTPVDADLEERVVLIGERTVAIRKLSRGGTARPRQRVGELREQRNHELQVRSTPPPRANDGRERKRTDEPQEVSAGTDAAAPAEATNQKRAAEETADDGPRTPDEAAASGAPSDDEEKSGDDRPRSASKTAAAEPPPDKKSGPADDSTTVAATATAPSTKTAIRRPKVSPRLPSGTPPSDAPKCYVGGCSGQVCSSQDGVLTTCEWRPEYACYQTAQCTVQADGRCGWTKTAELSACLEGAN